jgi:ABC-type sugar transport system ATPase subunit
MSVRDNIRFGRPTRPTPRSRRGRGAAAAEFIRALPQGYDTRSASAASRCPADQRQRIAIARAILRDAPLLLLDEATSSLDAESETAGAGGARAADAGRTTLVIAHRLATVLSCDRILVLDRAASSRRAPTTAWPPRRALRAARQAAVRAHLSSTGGAKGSASPRSLVREQEHKRGSNSGERLVRLTRRLRSSRYHQRHAVFLTGLEGERRSIVVRGIDDCDDIAELHTGLAAL